MRRVRTETGHSAYASCDGHLARGRGVAVRAMGIEHETEFTPRLAARTSSHRYEGPTSYRAASMVPRAPRRSRDTIVPAASGPSEHVSSVTPRRAH